MDTNRHESSGSAPVAGFYLNAEGAENTARRSRNQRRTASTQRGGRRGIGQERRRTALLPYEKCTQGAYIFGVCTAEKFEKAAAGFFGSTTTKGVVLKVGALRGEVGWLVHEKQSKPSPAQRSRELFK